MGARNEFGDRLPAVAVQFPNSSGVAAQSRNSVTKWPRFDETIFVMWTKLSYKLANRCHGG